MPKVLLMAVFFTVFLAISVYGVMQLTPSIISQPSQSITPASNPDPQSAETTRISRRSDPSNNVRGPGSLVNFLGESGTIIEGEIDNEIVITPTLLLKNGENKTVLYYEQSDVEEGHVEMIYYPQRGKNGEIYIKINGVDAAQALGDSW